MVKEPPPVLAGCMVLKYALIRRPIRYSGSSGLFVDHKELGPVPRLAIGETLYGQREFLLLHCTRSWKVLGVGGGYPSTAELERRAERIYPGVSSAWQTTNVTLREARRYEREIWKSATCSFCRRIPPEFGSEVKLISSRDANICSDCVWDIQREFLDS